jgi:hypothetical protein
VAADRPVVGLPDDLEEALGAFLEVRRDPRVQLEAATKAARAFLEALGVELTSAGMADTPSRMARAYAELLSSRPFVATHFSNDEKYDEIVLAKGIPFRSVCEHHMRPSPASPTWATCRASGAWGCPSWLGWWSTSPALLVITK